MLFALFTLLQLAPEVRNTVIDAITRMDAFSVSFQQETYSDYFDPTHASGRLSVDRPGRMKMVYAQGEHRIAVCDGDLFREYDYDAETLTETDQADMAEEPLVRIFLYGDHVDEYFLIDRYREGGQDIFRFRPRNRAAYTVEVRFDGAWRPTELHVIGQDGDGTIFRFHGYDLSPTFAADFFSLPEGIEIVE